jgi:hypothetical protein
MSESQAPIAIFAFNRPNHLANCLQSLERCVGLENSEGTIFIDGARNDQEADVVSSSVGVALKFASKYNFRVEARQENFGLAKSITSGIDEMFSLSSKLIVIEDDLILAKGFLDFMNKGLSRYENNSGVASISGYQYPIERELHTSVFLRGADCWGWATWKDRWEQTSFSGKELLNQIRTKKLANEFNLEGSNNYVDLLEKQILGEINSWAILWHTSMFLENRLSLYPPYSLVSNEGGDGLGTHFGNNQLYSQKISDEMDFLLPSSIEQSEEYRDALIEFYQKNFKRFTFSQRILGKLKRLF